MKLLIIENQYSVGGGVNNMRTAKVTSRLCGGSVLASFWTKKGDDSAKKRAVKFINSYNKQKTGAKTND